MFRDGRKPGLFKGARGEVGVDRNADVDTIQAAIRRSIHDEDEAKLARDIELGRR